jgi:hypothetical protein
MPHPKLSDTQIRELTSWVAEYISEQRASFRSQAASIEPNHKTALQQFFPATLLDEVKVVRGRAGEPSFYRQLRGLGIVNAPPFSDMAGITFQDVVVHAEPLTRSLLFHELVHAVQYSRLGISGFAEHYVRGFLSGGSYEEIPLEKQAYELEGRFASNPAEQFSVDADVRQRLRLQQL